MVAGKCGLNVAAISFCNSFQITCSSDTNVFTDVDKLCDLLGKNI